MSEPRCTWLALDGLEIVEMKQIVLDCDAAGVMCFGVLRAGHRR